MEFNKISKSGRYRSNLNVLMQLPVMMAKDCTVNIMISNTG